MKPVALILALVWATPASAHGFAGGGLLHPLTGPDHMLAMLAVGALSAQLGGIALWYVPAAFLIAMLTGGAVGLAGLSLSGTEAAIAASVLLLGAAITWARPIALPVAAVATLAFGFAHGHAHGVEMPQSSSPALYILGFLLTTAGLHVIGLVGTALIIERGPGGARLLRGLGGVATLIGSAMLLA